MYICSLMCMCLNVCIYMCLYVCLYVYISFTVSNYATTHVYRSKRLTLVKPNTAHTDTDAS